MRRTAAAQVLPMMTRFLTQAQPTNTHINNLLIPPSPTAMVSLTFAQATRLCSGLSNNSANHHDPHVSRAREQKVIAPDVEGYPATPQSGTTAVTPPFAPQALLTVADNVHRNTPTMVVKSVF